MTIINARVILGMWVEPLGDDAVRLRCVACDWDYEMHHGDVLINAVNAYAEHSPCWGGWVGPAVKVLT